LIEDPWLPLRVSLGVAVVATVVGFPLAVGLGYGLARSRSAFKPLVNGILYLPLVLPPVVTGLLLLRLLGRASPLGAALGALGIQVPFTPIGAVLAALVVGLPLYVTAARNAFEAVDPRLEEVAATLGDPPWRVFRRVTLPLALPGLLAGALLAFARALGEFGATIVLAGNTEQTRTLAVAVYASLDAPEGEQAIRPLLAMSVGVAALALVGFEALQRWQRRRLEVEGP
jgi:molybdate transport system permease protein